MSGPNKNFESVDIDDATIRKTEQTRPKADIIDVGAQVGNEIIPQSHAPVGSVEIAGLFRPVRSATTVTSSFGDFDNFFADVIPSPPNKVPFVTGVFVVESLDSGIEQEIILNRDSQDDNSNSKRIISLKTQSGTGTEELPFHRYLNEVGGATGGLNKNIMKFQTLGHPQGGSNGVKLLPSSCIKLCYEVI